MEETNSGWISNRKNIIDTLAYIYWIFLNKHIYIYIFISYNTHIWSRLYGNLPRFLKMFFLSSKIGEHEKRHDKFLVGHIKQYDKIHRLTRLEMPENDINTTPWLVRYLLLWISKNWKVPLNFNGPFKFFSRPYQARFSSPFYWTWIVQRIHRSISNYNRCIPINIRYIPREMWDAQYKVGMQIVLH